MPLTTKFILVVSGILFLAIFIASAVGLAKQKSPSSVPSLPLPTEIIESVSTPTSVLVQPSTTSTPSNNSASTSGNLYSSMRTYRIGWSVKVLGENSECIVNLSASPRSCDGNTLKITAVTPLLILKDNTIFARLKIGEYVEIEFDSNYSFSFYGLANRKHAFMSTWNASGYIWSESHNILLLPREDGMDEFIDLIDGVTYQIPADPTFFDFSVTSPTLGKLKCDGSCQFTP